MTDVVLAGRWELAHVLTDAARRRGIRLRAGDPNGRPVLGDGPVPLPTGADLRDAVLGAAIAAVARCLTPAPTAVTGTVLRPAGGFCGPAAAGPVDAVRDGGTVRLHPGLPAVCRLLDVQHTRCWVADLTFTGAGPHAFRPAPGVTVLPPAIARDTARACEYLLDSGEGYHWRPVLLAGPPDIGPDGRPSVLAMFTEARFVDELVVSCVDRRPPVGAEVPA